MVEKKPQSKQVYIMQNLMYPILKIGISDDPVKRLRTLEGGAGFPLELIFESRAILNPVTVERLIHQELKDYRKGGEWFDIDVETAKEKVEKALSDSESGEYKDILIPYQMEDDCVKLFEYNVFKASINYFDNSNIVEVEPFVYESKSYHYYIVFKQGDIVRTAKFCNRGIAIKFKKDNLKRLLRNE